MQVVQINGELSKNGGILTLWITSAILSLKQGRMTMAIRSDCTFIIIFSIYYTIRLIARSTCSKVHQRRNQTLEKYWRIIRYRLISKTTFLSQQGNKRGPLIDGYIIIYIRFIMGPERSGTTLHTDPLYTSAWNTSLCGHKRWVIFGSNMPKSVVKGK